MEGRGDAEDKLRGCTSQSPLPHPNPLDRISFHSRLGGTLSQGRGFLGSLERFDLYKESVGPLVVAWGSLSDVCFMWEVIDSAPDRKPVFFVLRRRG